MIFWNPGEIDSTAYPESGKLPSFDIPIQFNLTDKAIRELDNPQVMYSETIEE